MNNKVCKKPNAIRLGFVQDHFTYPYTTVVFYTQDFDFIFLLSNFHVTLLIFLIQPSHCHLVLMQY